jgi:hypothetical protein
MRVWAYITCVVLCGFLVSCKKQPASKIPGHYFASRAYGDETLDLLTNVTYLQVFTTRTTTRTNSGTWQFLPATRTVVLTNALIFDDGKGNPATTVVTNDWTLSLTNIAWIIMLEDRQAQPFSKD